MARRSATAISSQSENAASGMSSRTPATFSGAHPANTSGTRRVAIRCRSRIPRSRPRDGDRVRSITMAASSRSRSGIEGRQESAVYPSRRRSALRALASVPFQWISLRRGTCRSPCQQPTVLGRGRGALVPSCEPPPERGERLVEQDGASRDTAACLPLRSRGARLGLGCHSDSRTLGHFDALGKRIGGGRDAGAAAHPVLDCALRRRGRVAACW
jgi:hypothetical protein